MSPFPQKADIRQREGDVRLVPEADSRSVRYRAKPCQRKPALLTEPQWRADGGPCSSTK
jgi:hypothetical protein